ncbi:hypothetical protein HQQ94_18725 [Shewanella sp. VB17]|uniref:acyl-CoA reductase n=1 Tax=Shewanella sp. VB17 TaxID=2739432 RepID=UPI001565C366|nr:acyl-CoA reductase [Shewanella sp. VB17]NRD75219.1 hypothetical protein [Shewanella sp. VB17]
MKHLVKGHWITDEEILPALAQLSTSHTFNIYKLLTCLDQFSKTLNQHPQLLSFLRNAGLSHQEASSILLELAEFLSRKNIITKIKRELGQDFFSDPFELRRITGGDPIYEGYVSLGILTHITPANALTVSSLSAIEGLLTGNINLIKISHSDLPFAAKFFEQMIEFDTDNMIRDRVHVLHLSSQSKILDKILNMSDGICVWGGEASVAGVKAKVSAVKKIIDWGPKISLAFVSKAKYTQIESVELKALAKDICLFDQKACSSPQTLYLEVDDYQQLQDFGQRLLPYLVEVSQSIPSTLPDEAEQAEITNTVELHALESLLTNKVLLNDKATAVSLLLEQESSLRTSPLYRNIWLKPLLRKNIHQELSPFRDYLQTVGLCCDDNEYSDLMGLFLDAGVTRIRRPGEMLASYMGEPHDGRYALLAYMQRVSVAPPISLGHLNHLSELEHKNQQIFHDPKLPVMSKDNYQQLSDQDIAKDLYFKSGGSSGKTAYSFFTYDDYYTQMQVAADGLRAAGLDCENDLCMNLFFSGGLYGGFLSFFTILEFLKTKHLPMAAYPDLAFVSQSIVQFKVTTLLGMPSYLMQLFRENEGILKAYGGIKKVFYGGEAFSDGQRRYLQQTFGIDIIRSASYGSVDAGPLGFQCEHCDNGEHHLNQELQHLEILCQDADRAISGQEVGRLVFSSKVREGQAIHRYDVGDLGHWVFGNCPCLRQSPKFKLLGRSGDVFKISGSFFNYNKFVSLFSQYGEYQGELQLMLKKSLKKDHIELRVDQQNIVQANVSTQQLEKILLERYADINECVNVDQTLTVSVKPIPASEMIRTTASGKLCHIVTEDLVV